MEVNDPYFNWLCKKIRLNTPENAEYAKLVHELHEHAFLAERDSMDMNRAYDGLNLRSDYIRKYGIEGSANNRGACTMLELMIGLANRMAYLMESNVKPKRIAEFFWILVKNLGLSGMTDDVFDRLHGSSAVDKITNHINARDYLPNGSGGLFPIPETTTDMRNIELWYQMHAWLHANYKNEIL